MADTRRIALVNTVLLFVVALLIGSIAGYVIARNQSGGAVLQRGGHLLSAARTAVAGQDVLAFHIRCTR